MKKVMVLCASLLGALALLGPASASAQAPPPQLVACVGAATSDGSFAPQEFNIALPGVGALLSPQGCVTTAPAAAEQWLTGLLNGLGELELPSQLPTPDDLQNLLGALQNVDLENPLGAVLLLIESCEALHITPQCQFALAHALGAPIPLGMAELKGQSGFCWDNKQSGTGTISGGGGEFWQIEWTADYDEGQGLYGAISGKATAGFGANQRSYPLTGFIGPGCGAGAKGLVLSIQNKQI